MAETVAESLQPVGELVPCHNASPPTDAPIIGTYVTLERLSPGHFSALYNAIGTPVHAALWTYIPFGPHASYAEFETQMSTLAAHPTDYFFAVIPHNMAHGSRGKAAGIFAFINVKTQHRAAELGYVVFGDTGLQRSRAATEAFYLAARHAFEDCGCRRFVWKCDALNGPSRRAAGRLGFQYEGSHRHDLIVKGRNRDTAWFSILDSEWGACRVGLEKWLDAGNFDDAGMQKKGLKECREG